MHGNHRPRNQERKGVYSPGYDKKRRVKSEKLEIIRFSTYINIKQDVVLQHRNTFTWKGGPTDCR